MQDGAIVSQSYHSLDSLLAGENRTDGVAKDSSVEWEHGYSHHLLLRPTLDKGVRKTRANVQSTEILSENYVHWIRIEWVYNFSQYCPPSV